MTADLGKVLLIANPVAQNGRGAQAALEACRLLRERLGSSAVEIATTLHPKHAVDVASKAGAFDTVIALGGDGIIHEAVNGLMALPDRERPAFGVIPVGSGNDYAKTLALNRKDLGKAIEQLLDARIEAVDVGVCNGEYFAETVSFGLDAAIALDTVERRKRTGRTGTALYLSAGLDQLINHLDLHSFTMTLDGDKTLTGQAYMIAVQNGPSYGGGFMVAPQASIRDGKFDIVIARPPLTRKKAVFIFMLAKSGRHTGFDNLSFCRASEISLSFDGDIPVQIDGEAHPGRVFDIAVVPGALRVLIPARTPKSVLATVGDEPAYYGNHEDAKADGSHA